AGVAARPLLAASQAAVSASAAARDTRGMWGPLSAEPGQPTVQAGRSGQPHQREPRHQQGEAHLSPFSQPATAGASRFFRAIRSREPRPCQERARRLSLGTGTASDPGGHGMRELTGDVVAVLVVALLAGCTAIEKKDARQTESILAAAGFQMKPADTPDRVAHLQLLRPLKLVPHDRDGKLVYVYADPKACKCIWVGD